MIVPALRGRHVIYVLRRSAPFSSKLPLTLFHEPDAVEKPICDPQKPRGRTSASLVGLR